MPTKKQRNNIYKQMLAHYKEKGEDKYNTEVICPLYSNGIIIHTTITGLCTVLSQLFTYSYQKYFYKSGTKKDSFIFTISDLPELYRYKNNSYGMYWFSNSDESGYIIRVMVLLECIKLTNPKKK